MAKKEEHVKSFRGYGATIHKDITTMPSYESVDTIGLGNLSDYEKKKSKLELTGGSSKDINLTQESPDVVKVKGKNISKFDVLDTLDTKPSTLRSPKILALDKNISHTDAHKVIIETNNKIVSNNTDRKRADSLNIITVPKEEFERLAILGEAEKKIFGQFGQKGIFGKTINLSKQSDILRKYKSEIEKNELLIDNSSVIGTDKETERSIKARNNIDSINKKMVSELKLPSTLEVTHPFERVRDENGKLTSKVVMMNDIRYDILSDNANQSKSIYGKDESKIFIKGAKVDIIHQLDEKKSVKNIDFTRPIEFSDGQVLNEIINFQPDQVDLRHKPYDTISPIGSGTIRVGTETYQNPNLTEELSSLFYDPKNPQLRKWLEDPKNQIKFKHLSEQTKRFEDSVKKIPQMKCPNGSVPIRRKQSPNAWGMTPKQKVCDSELLSKRKQIRDNEIEDQLKVLMKKQPNAKKNQLHKMAEDNADLVLENDTDYKRIVGCNTSNELLKIHELESTGQTLKVPLRFPTLNAVGDVEACKTYKNARPNIDYQLYKVEKTKEMSDAQKRALLMFGENPTPDVIKREKLDTPIIDFREDTKRKKVQVLLKQDINKL